MMKTRIVAKIIPVSMLFSILALLACQSPSSNSQPKTHHYSLSQKCPTLLNMSVGETLIFNATENPSTGYQWKLLQPLSLFKTEESFQMEETDASSKIGAGGEKNYYFKAEKPGQALIQLAYVRAWETSPKAEQQWQCRVRVA